MTRIVWLPSMSVGIDTWDSDHRVLLELINRLDEAVASGRDATAVREAVAVLGRYAEIHFQSEERLMETLRYPRYASHKAQHDHMRAWIAERRAEIEAGTVGEMLTGMAEHLVHWLYTHVLTIDMQYSEFFDDQRRKVNSLLAHYKGLKL